MILGVIAAESLERPSMPVGDDRADLYRSIQIDVLNAVDGPRVDGIAPAVVVALGGGSHELRGVRCTDVVLPPFSELVDAYRRDVARLCAALAGPDDAEDAAQRTWLKALLAYKDLRHASNLRGWLLKIAANAAMDGHRARARRPVPVAQVDETAAGAVTNPDPADDDLWRRVRDLPERQRVAVTLRYGLDLAHEQIADVLDTTQAASRRLVSDGLATLRAGLEEVTT